MFKIISKWWNDYNEYQKILNEMGVFTISIPYGVYYSYILNTAHDRHNTIQTNDRRPKV